MSEALRTESELLAQTLLGWARGALAAVDPADTKLTGADDCTGCPLCRLLTRLRNQDPELATSVSEAINDAAGGVAKALRVVSEAVHAAVPEQRTSQSAAAEPAAERAHRVTIVEED